MSKDVELFRIETEEYDPFEGKSLDMLKHLINHCESVHIFKDCEGEIVIVGSKKDNK